MGRTGILLLAAIALVGVLVGCGGTARAPISQKQPQREPAVGVTRQGSANAPRPATRRPDSYVVVRGDTLHSIAWKFRVNYRDLARWNNLRDADLIYVGQRLRLKPPAAKLSRKAETTTSPKAAAKTRQLPSKKSQQAAEIRWRWPAQGKVRKATSALGSKGIEILGRRGSKIIAAGPGEVVYSGSGLRGYGKLIIIKHNETYLSAYAHNDKLLVAEGASISDGQAIALMGNSGTKRVMLHFEIRRDGKAVEPLNYLPRR